MRIRLRRSVRTVLFCLPLYLVACESLSPLAGQQEKAAGIAEALEEGSFSLALRYRYEWVSDDAEAVRDRDANASTLRTAVGYQTLPLHGLSLHLEVENVAVAGNDELFDNRGAGSLNNGVAGRPVVADPEGTEVNQAYLRYRVSDLTFHLGRQEIVLDDQRFVGNVGWRQNHQSFDGVSILSAVVPKTNLTYAYLNNVNTIAGGNSGMDSHLLQATVTLSDAVRVNAYAYLLDYEATTQRGLSTSTYGTRVDGTRDLGRFKLHYDAAYALQAEYAGNPQAIDADYERILLGADFGPLTIKVARELLSGSIEDGRFTTPLATLHAWNGWADKFLATPPQGLVDLYLTLSGARGAFQWQLLYHDFTSDSGRRDYGSEVDLLLTYKAAWGQSFGLKSAFYDAETLSSDTRKVMLFTLYGF